MTKLRKPLLAAIRLAADRAEKTAMTVARNIEGVKSVKNDMRFK